MNKKKFKKLSLSSETLRNLNETDLHQVAGAAATVAGSECTARCSICTHACSGCVPCA